MYSHTRTPTNSRRSSLPQHMLLDARSAAQRYDTTPTRSVFVDPCLCFCALKSSRSLQAGILPKQFDARAPELRPWKLPGDKIRKVQTQLLFAVRTTVRGTNPATSIGAAQTVRPGWLGDREQSRWRTCSSCPYTSSKGPGCSKHDGGGLPSQLLAQLDH